MLIAFSGKKQTGKDYSADLLASASPQLKFQRLNFADAVYEEVAKGIWPASAATKEHMLFNVAYMKDHKKHFRLILQGWGTDFRRSLFGPNYWIDQYERKLNATPDGIVVITTDVRFKNEAEYIKSRGGMLIRVERNTGLVDNHPSEIDLDDYKGFDFTVSNNGTKEQLLEQLKQIKK